MTKPGIIAGNLVSFAGAFLLASMGHVDAWLFMMTGAGVALCIASACIGNNLIDRDIDGKMARTCRRGLVTGAVSPALALACAMLLGAAGCALLAVSGGALVLVVVLVGYLNYVLVYSLYWKRRSVHGTLVGSLSGATAPVAGYCAVSGRIDREALLLLVIFGLWQMPHAYAIAVSRLRDYRLAAIPVLPLCRGIGVTQRHMLAYMAAFLLAALALPALHYAGAAFGVVMAVLGLCWLRLAWARAGAADDRAWARGVFGFSLVIVLALSLMMAIDYRAAPGGSAIVAERATTG